ncbi:hypothetical protein GALMADRAFT_228211 [Galerina marginata CBS 339.88]|uniref:Uncharacterized protein n=1 Tax=Galerina marginata (strain CBS 339.88) TaxID=685588 RepID=A0A067SS40_GALM3|nr:hypothetical protein GALMADRAFT_228211 [Galerina marginata CBS 339.88]
MSPPSKKTLRHVLSKSFGLSGEQNNGSAGKKCESDNYGLDEEECLLISASGIPCEDAEEKNRANESQCRPCTTPNKILHYIPGFTDTESDDADERTTPTPSSSPDSRRRRSKRRAVNRRDAETERTVYWGLRSSYYQPEFEIEKEDRTIASFTPLSPPPYHRPRESFLLL